MGGEVVEWFLGERDGGKFFRSALGINLFVIFSYLTLMHLAVISLETANWIEHGDHAVANEFHFMFNVRIQLL